MSKFCYACETYGASPNLDMFCAYYELQRQPKKAKVGGVYVEYQFASYAFMEKRGQKDGGLELPMSKRTSGRRTGLAIGSM